MQATIKKDVLKSALSVLLFIEMLLILTAKILI